MFNINEYKAENISKELFGKINVPISDTPKETGVSTGLKTLDSKIGGLCKGKLLLLASRPAQDKTAMALNIAYNAVSNTNVPTVIFSLGTSRQEILKRMVCSATRTKLYKLNTHWLPGEKYDYLKQTINLLAQTSLYIDDTPALSVGGLITRANYYISDLFKQDKKLGLIIIDALQYLKIGDNRYKRDRQIELIEIMRELKDFARYFEVPIIIGAQIKRYHSGNYRPQLSNLRGADCWADFVLFVHREGYYKRDDASLRNKAELIVAKNACGAVGCIELKYFSVYQLFTDPPLPIV
jgi:replicative DNA helicase